MEVMVTSGSTRRAKLQSTLSQYIVWQPQCHTGQVVITRAQHLQHTALQKFD